jgi:hypothetical protein
LFGGRSKALTARQGSAVAETNSVLDRVASPRGSVNSVSHPTKEVEVIMKRPKYFASITKESDEAKPFTFRWVIVALFIAFAIVNLDWTHLMEAALALVRRHALNVPNVLQGSSGTGDIVGGLELLVAAFLAFGWRGRRTHMIAKLLSLVSFFIALALLSTQFQLDFEVFGPNLAPHETGGGFFIKDLLLMAVAVSILAITEVPD